MLDVFDLILWGFSERPYYVICHVISTVIIIACTLYWQDQAQTMLQAFQVSFGALVGEAPNLKNHSIWLALLVNASKVWFIALMGFLVAGYANRTRF